MRQGWITMTDEKIGELLEGFANRYWSVPVVYVVDKIAEWHPELTAKQIERVLNRCAENVFWHHCTVETDGVEEAELVAEHLIALGGDRYDRFLAARITASICECDEKTLLNSDMYYFDIPEAKAVFNFG